MQSSYKFYAVKEGDTLPSIAAHVLGDASKWKEIADLNGLTGYLLRKQGEPVVGPSVGVLPIRRMGGNWIELNGDVSYVTAETYVYLQQRMADGSTKSEMAEVSSYRTLTTTVALKNNLANDFAVGAVTGTVHLNYDIAPIFMIKAGDMIKLPGAGESLSVEISSNKWEDLFGEDLGLDASGDLLVAGNGDLGTHKGIENLISSLLNRLESRRRHLPYHMGYGSNIEDLLGSVNSPGWGLLIEQDVRKTILSDPRIKNVLQLDLQSEGDIVHIAAVVETIAGQALTVNDEISLMGRDLSWATRA